MKSYRPSFARLGAGKLADFQFVSLWDILNASDSLVRGRKESATCRCQSHPLHPAVTRVINAQGTPLRSDSCVMDLVWRSLPTLKGMDAYTDFETYGLFQKTRTTAPSAGSFLG